MRVFLINLDKDTDRLAAADAQMKKHAVEYERFPAIYAKTLPQAELDKAVNKFRWWCCVGRPVLVGEIGCAFSHYTLYKKMIQEDIPYMCILEDDIILKDTFKETLNRVEKWINPSLSQVILLSNHTNEPETKEEIKKVGYGLCTESYVITQPAAKALLKENLPLCTPCDHWGRWAKHKAIELYLATPAPCSQNWDDFTSNMSDSALLIKKSDLKSYHKISHFMKRAIGVMIDKMICLFQH